MKDRFVQVIGEVSERCQLYVDLLLDTIEETLRPWQHLISSPPKVEIGIEYRQNNPKGYEEVGVCYVSFGTIRPLTYEYGTAKGERQDMEIALVHKFQHPSYKEQEGLRYCVATREWNVGRCFVEWELGFSKSPVKELIGVE